MDIKRAGVGLEPGDRPVSHGRGDEAGPQGDGWSDHVIEVGSLRLHIGRLEADSGSGRVPLTRLEFLLLRELMQHAGQPLSKRQLQTAVWGFNAGPDSNVVGVCIRRLRTKLGNHLIQTVRGEGYQIGVS